MVYFHHVTRVYTSLWPHVYIHVDSVCHYVTRWSTMGWLRRAGSLKSQVSFANEPYKRDYILQKKPVILRSLLMEGSAYGVSSTLCVPYATLCMPYATLCMPYATLCMPYATLCMPYATLCVPYATLCKVSHHVRPYTSCPHTLSVCVCVFCVCVCVCIGQNECIDRHTH